jgi:hypothetical protein
MSDSLQPVDEYSLQSLSFISPSGKLSYSFEILNETLQQSFVRREAIMVPDFSSDSLLMSDIILADKIFPSSGRSHFAKNDLDILPNLLQLFKGSDTLRVYFEIYNLTPDRNGNVFFRVESVVRKVNRGGLFGKLFKPDQKTISVVNEYSGKRTSEFIIQSIHLNNIDPGEYRFEIIIRDDIAKTNYKRSTVLTIL